MPVKETAAEELPAAPEAETEVAEDEAETTEE
jgi:hypothetical protein